MADVTLHGATAGPAITEKVKLLVKTKESWSGSWKTREYLTPIRMTETAAPSIPSLTLLWRYGEEIKREDKTAFEAVEPINLRGQFVEVSVVPNASGVGGQATGGERPIPLWTGVVAGETFDIHGADDSSGPQGDQVITAYGLEHILDRITIFGGYVEKDDTAKNSELGDDDEAVRIDWSPVFNERYQRGVQETGNRGGQVDGVYVFGATDDTWNHKQIIEYLLGWYGPENIEFKLGGETDPLEDLITRQSLEGLTLYQAISALIPRSRGLGWCLRVDDKGNVEIHVYTLVGETISAGEATLPANKEKVSFKLDDARDVMNATLRIDEFVAVDRIIVQGQRIKSMFHLSNADGTLEPGWTEAEETAYQAASGDEDGEKNDNERNTDKYHRVYRLFRVPVDWDWKIKNGFGDGKKKNANPAFTRDGVKEQNKHGAYWNANRAFLHELLLPKAGGADDTEPEYLDAAAFVAITTIGAGGYGQVNFVQVENLNVFDKSPGYLRMVDREMAVEVRTHLNHTFALGHWEADAAESAVTPEINWETLIVCVCAELDSRIQIEALVGEEVSAPDVGLDRTKVITVDDAEVWYVTPGTIYYVSNGFTRSHEGGIVRDDRERLEAIAAFAKGWYGEDRASITLTLQKVYSGLRVGTYVKDASSSTQRRNVGTVVTSRSWDLQQMTTTIQTQYSEVDFGSMA